MWGLARSAVRMKGCCGQTEAAVVCGFCACRFGRPLERWLGVAGEFTICGVSMSVPLVSQASPASVLSRALSRPVGRPGRDGAKVVRTTKDQD